MNDAVSSAGSRRLLLLGLAAALVAMLATAVVYRAHNPALVIVEKTQSMPDPAAAIDPVVRRVGELMHKLQENPSDLPTLLELAEHFARLQQWQAVEQFAQRALRVSPDDMSSHYLLGLALHGQQRHAEAAKELEEAVRIGETPALHYSLAMLYAYYLNEKDNAARHLRQGLEAPGLTPDLRAQMQSELEKLLGDDRQPFGSD